MIQIGLVYLQVDIYLQDMVAAAVIFFAVLIDAVRMRSDAAPGTAQHPGREGAVRAPGRGSPAVAGLRRELSWLGWPFSCRGREGST